MECPGFQVMRYGIYDSRVATPRLTQSPTRYIARYELELFTETLSGTTYLDETPYPLKKGLLMCCKPGQMRYSQLPIRCHYVHLRPQDPVLEKLMNQLPDACRLSDMTQVEAVFRELSALPAQADPLLVGSLVSKLVYLICQQTATELRTENTLTRSHRSMLMQTENYIRSNLAEDLNLEKLASRAKFSPSHFHRIFTAFFGKTPHEFILECRIEAAQAALQSDNCSLIELSSICGFSSQSHFCAQFKKATGQTPLQYRKAMLSRLEP